MRIDTFSPHAVRRVRPALTRVVWCGARPSHEQSTYTTTQRETRVIQLYDVYPNIKSIFTFDIHPNVDEAQMAKLRC